MVCTINEALDIREIEFQSNPHGFQKTISRQEDHCSDMHNQYIVMLVLLSFLCL